MHGRWQHQAKKPYASLSKLRSHKLCQTNPQGRLVVPIERTNALESPSVEVQKRQVRLGILMRLGKGFEEVTELS